MAWPGSTFTDTDSILSRRDALLRVPGVTLWSLVAAWVAIVALWIAGLHAPAWLALPVAMAACGLAWRRLSARILPDGVTRLEGRRLQAMVVSLAIGALGALLMAELVLHGSLRDLTPFAPWMAAPVGGVSAYLWARWVLRRDRRITLRALMDALTDD